MMVFKPPQNRVVISPWLILSINASVMNLSEKSQKNAMIRLVIIAFFNEQLLLHITLHRI